MKIPVIKVNNVHPTDKKMKKAKKMVEGVSGLPIEIPIETNYKFNTIFDRFEKVKNAIQTSIDNMRGN